jgi:RNA polymerase sigma-70 factor (ECF subfamily)
VCGEGAGKKEPPTDAHLALVSRTGDLAAFGELVTRYQRRVFGLCYRLLGRYHDAEDASQEAFLRAYRARSLYDPARPFDRWLLTIAANCCVTMLRRRRPTAVELTEEDGEDEGKSVTGVPGPAEEAQRREFARAVAQAIAALEDTYRLPLVLFHQEEMRYEDIAQALSIPLGTVKSRVHRARAQLYHQLTRAGFLTGSRGPQAPGRSETGGSHR